MSTDTKMIRNIALLGHGGNGKTTLAENILSICGITDRVGKVADGNTVSDYDAEEIRRKISISASTMNANWQGHKFNIIDTPGFFDFAGEVRQALRVADLGLICVAAKKAATWALKRAGSISTTRICPARSTFPSWTRKTPTLTPRSTRCALPSAILSAP